MMRAAFTARAIDSNTIRSVNYDPLVDKLRAIVGSRETRPLGDWVSSLGKAYAAVLTRVDCDPSLGDDLLSQVDAFASEPSGRWIRGDLMRFVEDLRIQRGDILLAGAGQIGPSTLFGRSVIADSRLAGKLAAGDLMLLRGGGTDDDDVLYLYAFLSSRVGLSAVRSCAYGTSIPRMRPDLFSRLPIPVPSDTHKRQLSALVREAMKQREKYAVSLAAARRVIEELPEVQEAREMCTDRRARCISWNGELPTIGAWNFASTGEARATLGKHWTARLGDVVPAGGIFRGNRFARVSCQAPYGKDLISQRDAFLMRPIAQRIAISDAELSRLTVPIGSLLVGGQGTLGEGEIFGRVALVTKSLDGKAISEHLLRIQPGPTHRGVVYAYFSSLLGLRLLRSAAVGTKLLSLRPDLLLGLPIPPVSEDQRHRIDAAVNEALAAHSAAERAETSSTRIVEEEVLPQWLA